MYINFRSRGYFCCLLVNNIVYIHFSSIHMVVLTVKDIASSETEGRVYTDALENTLGSAFLQAY